MADPIVYLKRFGAACALLFVCLAFAAVAHADVTLKDGTVLPSPESRVIKVSCAPGQGMVNGVLLVVAGPGVVELHWDNRDVCGLKS